jgi:hypothetical protein
VPVRGGAFGNNTETSVGALLVDAFGEGVLEALLEIATAKEIAAEREKAEKAEAAKLAKEEAKEDAREAKEEKEAHKAVHPVKHH